MLKISEKFEIREDDELNYGLYELKDVTDKQTKEKRREWKHIGYFAKVSHALSAALNKYIKQMIGQETLDCRMLAERLDKLEKDLYWVDVKHEPKIRPIKGVNVKEITKKENEDETGRQVIGRHDPAEGF